MAQQKFAMLDSDEITAFPLHETCIQDYLTDHPDEYALPIRLTAHRQRETCFQCGRPVCGTGKVPATISRAGNEWDFIRA